MAAQSPPFVIQASSHGAALFRQQIAALLGLTQPGTLALGTGGVVNTTDLVVTQNGTPNMSVNVAGGVAMIPQTLAANGGIYTGLNDATVNLAISAANATNPRIDTVIASVADAAYSGGSNNWTLSVLTGTPTAGATLANLNGQAAQSASSVLLANVLVPANATTIITADIQDARTFAGNANATRNNPTGRSWATTGGVGSTGTWNVVNQGGSSHLKGGMTSTVSGLVVPVAGLYQVNAQIKLQSSSAQLQCGIGVAGALVAEGGDMPVGSAVFLAATASDVVSCTAGQVINLLVNSSVNVNFQIDGPSQSSYISAALVSS